MESTRVFVGGLPPTCSNDQLKKHFSTRFQVTDAHVLPKRRMGFVGFKSHEAAQQAVKHFNKTYMKMSKISVDIARPIDSNAAEDAHPTRRRDATNNEQSVDGNLKRKREDKAQDPKLQEYLSVMGGSSKTRTWANDDDMIKPSAEPAPVINQPTQEEAEEEEFQELPSHPKKARTEKPATPQPPQPEPMVVDQSEEVEPQEAPEKESQAETEVQAAPMSDADWLRSKTSRLLGLLDEDEQDEFEQHKADAPSAPAASTAPAVVAPAPSSPGDESPQRGEESRTMAFESVAPNTTDDDSNTQSKPEDPNVDLIRNSARLFLRNLAYDTTESDLQPIFERFGKLEEVSYLFLLLLISYTYPHWYVGFAA
ncbi:unnamed protein product [Penicillium olsonii]|nr:unnamed protein product [Penicillium olsonii]